jgi:hypothetical protein
MGLNDNSIITPRQDPANFHSGLDGIGLLNDQQNTNQQKKKRRVEKNRDKRVSL